MAVVNKLEEARRKLGSFSFENLPLERNDVIWAELRLSPYNLDLEELSALKNARCSTPFQPEEGNNAKSINPTNMFFS